MERISGRIVLALIIAGAAAYGAFAQSAPITAEANGIKVSIVVNGANAEVTVSAPANGWVAVGFNPTTRMKDANFLIGYVKDGVAYARDDFGVGPTGHQEDEKIGGKNDLLSFKGVEADGMTTMTFVIPRDSGDSKDSKLGPGTHNIIVGMSGSDNFTGFHSKVGKTTITLP
jgi:hypothetical protein